MLLLLLLPIAVSAQNLGMNGQGFFPNHTEQDLIWLEQLPGNITIALPAGSDIKFTFPSADRPGFGLNIDSIEAWFANGGESDEVDESLEKYQQKYDVQEVEFYSYVDSIIGLQERFGSRLRIIWGANVTMGTIESNIPIIQYLLDNGVNIVSIRICNETYSQFKLNNKVSFPTFIERAGPIAEAIAEAFPSIPLAWPIAPNLERNDHVDFNQALFDYIKSHPDMNNMVDVHLYLGEEEVAQVVPGFVGPQKNSINYTGEVLPELVQKFDDIFYGLTSNQHWPDMIVFLQENLPGVAIQCTEWNTQPAAFAGNTIANAAWQFRTMMLYRQYFSDLCIHNGISADIYGMICRAQENDLNPEGYDNLRRTGYYAQLLAREVPEDVYEMSLYIMDVEPGVHYLWYANMGDSWTPDIDINGSYTVQNRFVAGSNPYSSAGNTGFMKSKQSIATYEVNGIQETATAEIPANSFGYLKIIVEAKVIDTVEPDPIIFNPPACKKPWWCFLFKKANRCAC